MKHILQHRIVQTQVGDELFELAVFLIQLAQFRHAQAAVFLLPVEKRGFADAHLSTDLGDGRAALGLTQCKRDLLFDELGLFMTKQPLGEGRFCQKTLLQNATTGRGKVKWLAVKIHPAYRT